MSSPDQLLEVLWKFVRGDLQASDFETWLYRQPDLESQLGKDLYLAAISTDFSNRSEVWKLRCALADHVRARTSIGCMCIRLRDVDVVDMGTFPAPEPAFEGEHDWSSEDVLRTLYEVQRRGSPLWWLWAARCRACGQGWLVGSEERQNDVYCMKRLAPEQLREIVDHGRWPSEFDTYEALLRIGLDAGRSVGFVDPLSSSMNATVVDLAKARPGICVSEIAKLLSLDLAIATELARRAVEREGVRVVFDTDLNDS
jgi:hypothetical protein